MVQECSRHCMTKGTGSLMGLGFWCAPMWPLARSPWLSPGSPEIAPFRAGAKGWGGLRWLANRRRKLGEVGFMIPIHDYQSIINQFYNPLRMFINLIWEWLYYSNPLRMVMQYERHWFSQCYQQTFDTPAISEHIQQCQPCRISTND